MWLQRSPGTLVLSIPYQVYIFLLILIIRTIFVSCRTISECWQLQSPLSSRTPKNEKNPHMKHSIWLIIRPIIPKSRHPPSNHTWCSVGCLEAVRRCIKAWRSDFSLSESLESSGIEKTKTKNLETQIDQYVAPGGMPGIIEVPYVRAKHNGLRWSPAIAATILAGCTAAPHSEPPMPVRLLALLPLGSTSLSWPES